MPLLYIGLMSGTSLDGVDGLLADFSGSKPVVVGVHTCSFAPELRAELLALNTAGPNELHRAALAANALARVYAQVVQALLAGSKLPAPAITAAGVHGQTVRHRPSAFDGTGYTLQLNNPALLAELTGIDVVADFRSRDVAAGGQGAPLAPAFHQAVFAQTGQTVGVLNIGGIANLTVLDSAGGVVGFDCGPGNALMDHWCQQHTGEAYDCYGAWAAGGAVFPQLLAALRDEPFLRAPPPKSTGRDLFNPEWLARKLGTFASVKAQDVQATLTEFTASTCVDAVLGHANSCERLMVCGGGAFNAYLMARIAAALPGVVVASTAQAGVDPMHVEALAFAWLAKQTVERNKLELQSITGAPGARVLGCIYPG